MYLINKNLPLTICFNQDLITFITPNYLFILIITYFSKTIRFNFINFSKIYHPNLRFNFLLIAFNLILYH